MYRKLPNFVFLFVELLLTCYSAPLSVKEVFFLFSRLVMSLEVGQVVITVISTVHIELEHIITCIVY
jgi:hypothetical protein